LDSRKLEELQIIAKGKELVQQAWVSKTFMNHSIQNPTFIRSARRRNQAIQFLLLLLVAVVLYGTFADGAIDKAVTTWFYDGSSSADSWSHQNAWWVQVFYKGVPVLTALFAVAILTITIAGTRIREYARWRGRMVGILLLIIMGPGLIVNATLKDNWGRPRPFETVDYGGSKQFQAPFVMSDQGGKSFPCGHCSIPFAFGALAWWSQKRSIRAAVLAAALSIGMITGMARVAVGAHYFSDVLASAWAVALAAWTLGSLWPSWLRLSEAMDPKNEPVEFRKWLKGMAVSVLVLAVVVGALLGIPYDRKRSLQVDLPGEWSGGIGKNSSTVIRVRSSRLPQDQEIALRMNPEGQLELTVRVTGFGFTWNNIRWSHTWILTEEGDFVLVLSPQIRGVFTEFRMSVS
jgi:lipid A 4'-phosphatase